MFNIESAVVLSKSEYEELKQKADHVENGNAYAVTMTFDVTLTDFELEILKNESDKRVIRYILLTHMSHTELDSYESYVFGNIDNDPTSGTDFEKIILTF